MDAARAQRSPRGDLLDDFDGIGDAAAPEGIPEGIDFAAYIACEHMAAESASLWGFFQGGRTQFFI
jgi:hypothetical protein